MDREKILFRGKSAENGEWFTGQLLHFKSPVSEKELNVIVEGCEWDDSNEWFSIGRRAKVVPETVGQYIGLNDRQDKPIFEGDIVEVDMRDDVFLVKYDEDDAIWFVSNCNDNLSFRENISNYNCVVIGNIYDDPELLPDYLR